MPSLTYLSSMTVILDLTTGVHWYQSFYWHSNLCFNTMSIARYPDDKTASHSDRKSRYEVYVAGNWSIGPQVCATVRRARPVILVNCTVILLTAMTDDAVRNLSRRPKPSLFWARMNWLRNRNELDSSVVWGSACNKPHTFFAVGVSEL